MFIRSFYPINRHRNRGYSLRGLNRTCEVQPASARRVRHRSQDTLVARARTYDTRPDTPPDMLCDRPCAAAHRAEVAETLADRTRAGAQMTTALSLAATKRPPTAILTQRPIRRTSVGTAIVWSNRPVPEIWKQRGLVTALARMVDAERGKREAESAWVLALVKVCVRALELAG